MTIDVEMNFNMYRPSGDFENGEAFIGSSVDLFDQADPQNPVRMDGFAGSAVIGGGNEDVFFPAVFNQQPNGFIGSAVVSSCDGMPAGVCQNVSFSTSIQTTITPGNTYSIDTSSFGIASVFNDTAASVDGSFYGVQNNNTLVVTLSTSDAGGSFRLIVPEPTSLLLLAGGWLLGGIRRARPKCC